jgi:2-polyprenyl-3-methyl-5-hydroxy-6-metoxy-1,4-benzoquinol methylase
VPRQELHRHDIRLRDVEDLRGIGTFDRVVCAGVLDFVVDPDLAFANVCRLVASGGRLGSEQCATSTI